MLDSDGTYIWHLVVNRADQVKHALTNKTHLLQVLMLHVITSKKSQDVKADALRNVAACCIQICKDCM